jgi:fused signal recognition particle receptor
MRLPPPPKIPDPTLLKLLPEVPKPLNAPLTTSSVVEPAPVDVPVPAPDPSPPAVPKKLVAVPAPPPKFVASPVLDPVPTDAPPINIPKELLVRSEVPAPLPNPPVAPVETGTTTVTNVGSVKPLEEPEPPFLLPPLLSIAVPGIVVVTVLNATGLTPAPNCPIPFDVVVPSKLRVPTPITDLSSPACEPVPPAAALPIAVPKEVSRNPELPEVVLKAPDPVAVSVPRTSPPVVSPTPVAVPPPVAIPEVTPPLKLCNFLDPLRLRRVILLILEVS